MAIYSLSASMIGRSTHAPGTAGAHLAYIGRPGAAEAVIGERMPTDIVQARAWIDEAEPHLRKNGRVLSKYTLSLPTELTEPADRMALVRKFAETVSLGQVPWLAAVHRPSAEGDERNWHAHVAIHDRHPVSGKTIAGLSDKGTLERTRVTWERLVNEALERVGSKARVDHRSLAERGIDRARPIHHGPAVTALERRGARTIVGDLSDSIETVDASRAAVVVARSELAELELELRAAQAREAIEKARSELAALQHEQQLAREAEWHAEVRRELAAEDARKREIAETERAVAAARQIEIERSAAAAAAARQIEIERSAAAAAAARQIEIERSAAAAAAARQIEIERSAAAAAAARQIEIERSAAAAAAARQIEIERSAAATAAARPIEPPTIMAPVSTPARAFVAPSGWDINALSTPRRKLAGFLIAISLQSSMKKSLTTVHERARAILGPELVGKLRAWTIGKREAAAAGDADAARSLKIVTEGWTASFRDQAGAFVASRIEQTIADIEREDDTVGGSPTGAAQDRSRSKRTGPER